MFGWLMGLIKKVIPKEYLCQIWYLYPHLKDYSENIKLSAALYIERGYLGTECVTAVTMRGNEGEFKSEDVSVCL